MNKQFNQFIIDQFDLKQGFSTTIAIDENIGLKEAIFIKLLAYS
jgi:hypothetical protein